MSKAFPKEADVKNKVKKALEKQKWFWWMPAANGFGKAGVSDFHALKNGVFLAIETKNGNNKPTPTQRAFLSTVNSQNAFGFVVTDKTTEVFEKWLDAFERATQEQAKGNAMSDELGAFMLEFMRVMTADLA